MGDINIILEWSVYMNNYKKATNEEMEVLFNAVEDFKEKGVTDIKCPRCGEKLDFYKNNSAYSIKCSSNVCLMANRKEIEASRYKIPTDEEMEVLFSAVEDFNEKGVTDIKCPRCGKELVYHRVGSSYSIKCSSNNCLISNIRGF